MVKNVVVVAHQTAAENADESRAMEGKNTAAYVETHAKTREKESQIQNKKTFD